jgi:hypothetical protein
MAVTLAQAKLNTTDDIQAGVIDEFRKSSFILDNIAFDDAVTPGTNGATLTYGYTRLITQPTASFRAINSEYGGHIDNPVSGAHIVFSGDKLRDNIPDGFNKELKNGTTTIRAISYMKRLNKKSTAVLTEEDKQKIEHFINGDMAALTKWVEELPIL